MLWLQGFSVPNPHHALDREATRIHLEASIRLLLTWPAALVPSGQAWVRGPIALVPALSIGFAAGLALTAGVVFGLVMGGLFLFRRNYLYPRDDSDGD